MEDKTNVEIVEIDENFAEMFRSLVRQRQSCRSFSTRDISRETLNKILSLTMLSPSACNSQPYSLVAICGDKAREAAPAMQMLGTNKFTKNCPAFVAVVEEKSNLMEKLGERFTGQDFSANDIGIAVAHMVLAAKSLGVDSCILGSFKENMLRDFLGFKKGKRIRLVVALGYAEEGYPLRDKTRKSPVPITFVE